MVLKKEASDIFSYFMKCRNIELRAQYLAYKLLKFNDSQTLYNLMIFQCTSMWRFLQVPTILPNSVGNYLTERIHYITSAGEERAFSSIDFP